MQIQQVGINLVSNAAEAGGGRLVTIRVETGVADYRREDLASLQPQVNANPGKYVHLIVSDNGQGFDAETKSKIFDPFFTTKHGHKGVGLAVVLGIVHRHGGMIGVESKPGRGGVFTLLFPAA